MKKIEDAAFWLAMCAVFALSAFCAHVGCRAFKNVHVAQWEPDQRQADAFTAGVIYGFLTTTTRDVTNLNQVIDISFQDWTNNRAKHWSK